MKYFITEQDIKDNTTIQQNVDASLLAPFIPLAQDKQIKKVLSMELYATLMSYLQTGETDYLTNEDGNYVTDPQGQSLVYPQSEEAKPADMLLDELLAAIKPALVYWTAVEALPFLQTRITNKGLLNKAGSEGIDAASYKALEHSFRSTALHYQDELIKFLEKNAKDYPGYKAPKRDSITSLIAGICFD